MNNTAADGNSGTIREFYEFLLKSDRASAKYLYTFQNNVLKDLLAFAAKTPFYRARLSPFLLADGSFDLNRWNEIPILTADELRNNAEALRCYDLPENHGSTVRYHTSGSTGKSLAVYRSRLSESGQNAATFRFYSAFRLDPSCDFAMIRGFDPSVARFRADEAKTETLGWGRHWLANGKPGKLHRKTSLSPLSEQLAWLHGIGRVYLNTFASHALALARHVSRSGGPRLDIPTIINVGEPLTEETRKQVKTQLGARLIDIYSNAECGVIACECPEMGRLHLQSELGKFEIIAEDGEQATPGQWGRLVATPFYNFAMPLIRYDTGDLVRMAQPCACGRNHPAIDRLLGRPTNLLRKPDGEWFLPDVPTEAMEQALCLSPWQVEQSGSRTFVLRYSSKVPANSIDLNLAEDILRHAIGFDCAIKIETAPALGPSSSGKFFRFRNTSDAANHLGN